MTTIQPGTRVIVEGPYGGLTSAARRRPRAALIAGGVGITPIRALLEDMPASNRRHLPRGPRGRPPLPGRARRAVAAPRRAVHYVLGDQGDGVLSPEHLRELVPDIAERDVYVCGPVA